MRFGPGNPLTPMVFFTWYFRRRLFSFLCIALLTDEISVLNAFYIGPSPRLTQLRRKHFLEGLGVTTPYFEEGCRGVAGCRGGGVAKYYYTL